MPTQASSGIWVIALVTAGSMRAVMPEPCPTGARRGDHVVVVIRGVAAHGDLPGRPRLAGGDQGVGDQARRALGGVRRAPAQPGRGDHRRRQRSGDDREQRVEPLDLGVPVARALLLIAVGRYARVTSARNTSTARRYVAG